MDQSHRDDFWDISKLSPNAKKVQPRFKTDRETVSYEISGDEKAQESKITLLGRGATAEESTYVPLTNPLIRKVTIRRFVGGYDFYESFRKAALLYYDVAAETSPFVPFYSYMPQYAQMNTEQKSYYFYLRSQIRCGNYSLKADVSYLYLYVYEILNLPEKIPPREGILLLCKLWKEYRRRLPAIDRYFSVWIQDYCIVHRLGAPTAQIEDFIFNIIDVTSFKEFYLGSVYSGNGGEITALLSCLSDYDWRTGRYAGGESGDMYKKHIEGAMLPVLRALWEKGTLFSENATPEKITRDVFPCSLCTHSVKCRIEIEYYPLGRSDEVRARVTSALKYVENCLRAALSVKSRLAAKNLYAEDKALIDAYFLKLFHALNEKRRLDQRESYEALYDAPSQKMSFAGADAIEQSSWENTWRLVEDESVKEVSAQEDDATNLAVETTSASPKEDHIPSYLQAILNSDDSAKKEAVRSADLPEEILVEKINDIFYAIIDDVVLEIRDGCAVLIEDYREDVEAWLKTQM